VLPLSTKSQICGPLQVTLGVSMLFAAKPAKHLFAVVGKAKLKRVYFLF